MFFNKDRYKNDHVLIVTSDAADASVKQYRIKPWLLETIILLLCIIIGSMIGYLLYEDKVWQKYRTFKEQSLQTALDENQALQDEIAALLEDKQKLENEIEDLNSKVILLSDTVNEKVERENELMNKLEKQHMPTEFPLSSSGSMVEKTVDGQPVCEFTSQPGAMIVAAASGTVIGVNDDVEYGHNVWVDHGNGYITVYRNKGESLVKLGQEVTQGETLFTIGDKNKTLGYQIMKDDFFIDPMDILSING